MVWGILFLLILITLIDLAVFSGILRIFNLNRKPKSKKTFKIIFWSFSILFILFSLIFIIIEKISAKPDYVIYRGYFTITGAFILIYLPKLFFAVFVLVEFIIRYFALLLSLIFKPEKRFLLNSIITLKAFSIAGLLIFIFLFFITLNGIITGKTNFKTEHITLKFKDLPRSFDGIRIAQISDMHLGSFYDSLDVRKGIVQLMNEKPDIIVFTGDMINNQSEEAKIMLPELKRMHATMGMYSILGNHDVGDYRRWKTIKEKSEDNNLLFKVEEEAGFVLLNNKNVVLKKGNDSIVIIGVESWGIPPFKKYGKLNKAMEGVENIPFKILLTHNPTHWDRDVVDKKNIELSLSGHTHAMQFGINCCGIFWSPLKWMYPHWAGLYGNNEQYLYVNRGFGYLGLPGRVGMTPEITIIELRKK